MHGPAWTSKIAAWVRRPSFRIVLVLVLGTCLWAAAGRREEVVEHQAGDVRPSGTIEESDRAAVLSTQVVDVARRLPQRQMDDPEPEQARPIRADYETETGGRDANVHAVGFSAEVRANSPAWLTGTIEFEE